MTDIILSGFGGQGILTAGKILITIAAEDGKNVSWISSYGAEMRGGTASCSVVISEDEIGSPYPDMLDILVAMNEPAYNKFIDKVREGGVVIVNKSLVKDREYRKDVKTYEVEANSIANLTENPRGTNIAMLGGLIKATEIIDYEVFASQLEKYFSDKGRKNPKNDECYKQGYKTAKKIN